MYLSTLREIKEKEINSKGRVSEKIKIVLQIWIQSES